MLFLLLACHSAPTPAPAGDTAAEVTWYRDVRPVVDAHCARCHADGGQASSFADPDTARALAPTMAAYVAAGVMPPAAPDPACRDYEGSDGYVLDEAERAVFAAWEAAGAPLGDPADAPPAPPAATEPLTAPFDVEVRGGVPYSPDFPADGNDYRCFLHELGNDRDVYLTGLEAMVDQLAIVHHVVLFLNDGGPTDDGSGGDPAEGFACSGLGASGWQFVAAWAPGANPVIFPEASGYRLPAGTQLILQMHYFDSFEGAEDLADRSGYGLHLADSVEREVRQWALGPTDFTIPAGEADHEVTARARWSYGPQDVLGVWPHMHVLGAGIHERVTHADGSESCLLRQEHWSFHNQVFAGFTEPVRIDDGDTVKLTCTYDNSADNPEQLHDPPRDVGFGEGTGDEMCFGFTYTVDPAP